jgi:hypothetical protein
MLEFPQYSIKNLHGDEFIPYFKNGQWYLMGDEVKLETIGKLCKLDEEELTYLCLTYGK